jgi:hypothetical protein
MLVALQLVGVATVPLKVIVPCVAPKFLPVIVTKVPTAPEFGLRLVMLGLTGGGGSWALARPVPDTATDCTPREYPLRET